jgi:hypothetical protein
MPSPWHYKSGKGNFSEVRVLWSPVEQERHYRYNVTLNCVRSTTAALQKTIRITISECVFVAFVLQRARAILSSVACTALQYFFFPYYLINCTIFERKILIIKCVFSLSLQIFFRNMATRLYEIITYDFCVPSSDIMSIPNFVKSSKVKSADGLTNMTTDTYSYLLWKEQTWSTVKSCSCKHHEGAWGSRRVLMPNRGTRWKWVVSSCTLSIYPRYSLNRRMARTGLLTLDKRKVPMCLGVTKPTFQLKTLAILLILYC